MWEDNSPLDVLREFREWQSFRLGLDRISRALERVGHPHRAYPHYLIGGTNGKGTVAYNLARRLPGKVGLFLSPHVMDVRERITLAGEWFNDGLWQHAYERLSKQVAKDELSYFEWLTLLAVEMFAQAGVSSAVFEVGLGGRWDATNALDPALSALTNVSLDHTAILGDNVAAIAAEKIEIARAGRPFVYPRELNAIESIRRRMAVIGCRGVSVTCGAGFAANGAILDGIAEVLKLPDRSGELAMLPGRRERIEGPPPILIDGAHNPAGWEALVTWVRATQATPLRVLATLSADRDPETFLRIMKPIASQIYRLRAGFERELAESCWPEWVPPVTPDEMGRLMDEPLLVCGSLYGVGFFKRWMKKELNQG